MEILQQYLDRGCGLPIYLCAYRKCHSTETALLKAVNDLLLAADHEVSAFCLLDLSAAFYTMHHELLLSRLQTRFVVVGTKLVQIVSHKPIIRGHDVVQLVCSVPQGSILGPLLFLLYTAELEDVAAGMGSAFTCTLMILSYRSIASRQDD
jgi:Reverse transcriptase (RNA-dependent DNA polymerase)